ncbi:hypothetical protein RclHR1_00020057 [Rhizophagus clarus]|uniref:F-box domain-containing protein n=1 Tax=Rhizophagus clarus TaxID=94130 RepID=A0A2Z6R3V6_9GLOM|nr:hypothetical protein RclHR1_00020057 [Rhizophagus clarus]GES80189.1 hypothetical protein GLOIN_2v1884114 [Rhizophagus clarus]
MSLPILNADIISEIIEKLRDNGDSLFHFLCVNKFFSEIAVSVLWENPFKIRNIKNSKLRYYSIIQTYIQSSNEEDLNEINNLINGKIKFKNGGKPLFFQYGKYLKEFQLEEIKKAINSWYNNYKGTKKSAHAVEELIMKSILRQCQRLDLLEWDICFENGDLLKILQYKIKDLKNLTIICHEKCITNIFKFEYFEYFKNHSKNISNLTIDNMVNLWPDKITKEFISFIESQNDLNEFIFDNKGNNVVKDPITNILELRANNLTKVILIKVNFSNVSFDYLDKCINLEILGLRSNENLKFDDMDLYSNFKNLKKLDLSYNDWSPKVINLIIKKAGNGLFSLTIGEGDTEQAIINDNTLITLTKSCPNIKSLSISKISNEKINMIFSYLKDFKLVTLKIFQTKAKGTVMNSEILLNYIKNEESLSMLGLGKNDTYWSYYNNKRRNFEELLKEHNIELVGYRPNVLKM